MGHFDISRLRGKMSSPVDSCFITVMEYDQRAVRLGDDGGGGGGRRSLGQTRLYYRESWENVIIFLLDCHTP